MPKIWKQEAKKEEEEEKKKDKQANDLLRNIFIFVCSSLT